MKKPIFILRLGATELITLDREAIGHLQEELEDIGGCIIPFGVLTIISTDLSPKELKDLYIEAVEKLDDHAPVIIWDPSSEDAAFDLRDFPQVKELINIFETHHDINIIPVKNEIASCNMSLDELIDKVGRMGRESLTPIEFARLEELSKTT